jgi:high-affinity iron transporter
MELDLGMKEPALKTELEVLFGALNGNAMRGAPKAELERAWEALRIKLEYARTLYADEDAATRLGTFVKSLLILLREGAEAMLVVGALAAYVRRAGAADRVWVIYAGVGVAIPLSLLTGWAIATVLAATGASLAVVEGVTMLLAAAVLFYVSAWMFSKREAERWQRWVAGQADKALSTGSLAALGAAACLAVYREGAETVLFYQALAASAPGQGAAIAAGFGAAALLLVGLYFLMRRAALRLPFGLFFGVTAALLYAMCVIFVGHAIVELQAAAWLVSTYLPGFPHVSWLGVAPTREGLLAQGALIAIPLVWWAYTRVRRPAGHEQPAH